MFDAWSFAEIHRQHAELLPARTVLSLFSLDGGTDIVMNTCQSTTADKFGLVTFESLTGFVCQPGTALDSHGS